MYSMDRYAWNDGLADSSRKNEWETIYSVSPFH